MKRILSILLLVVMTVVAVQPVLAMHYCGGHLYSLNLLENNDSDNCCGEKSTHMNDHDCCPTEHPNSNSAHKNCVSDINDNCCDTQSIKFEADDFLSEINQVNLNAPVHTFGILWVAIESFFKQFEQNKNTSILTDAFPSDGLFLKDVSINTFVCTFRI